MKKALAILMVLAAITGVVFAEAAPVAVAGNATLTWGIALDDPAPNGFNNEAEWTVTIPLLTKQTFTKKSDGDAYAEISIKDAVYVIEGDHDGDTAFTAGDKEIDAVEAKLVFGAVTMTVYDKPGFKVNNAEIWEPIKADDYYGDSPKEGTVNTFEPGFDGYGTKISYKADMFEIGVKVGSQMTWERAATAATTAKTTLAVATSKITVTAADVTAHKYTFLDGDEAVAGDIINIGDSYWLYTPAAALVPASRTSKYAFGVDGSVTPSDMVSASATLNYASWDATRAKDDKGVAIAGFMSAGAKLTLKPIADLEVMAAVDAGNDYMNTGAVVAADVEQVWAYDALLSAKYKFLEAGAYYGTVGTPFFAYDSSTPVEFKVSNLAAYGKVTDGGMVPNLTASATLIVSSLLADADSKTLQAGWAFAKPDTLTAPLALGVTAAYKYAMGDVNYLKPGFEFFAQNMAKGKASEGTDWVSAGNVYVEYGLFSNTTVTAKYEAGATNDDLKLALIKTPSRTTDGIFTLACKVSY